MSHRQTDRAERLLDLVSLLLGADHPISWAELREAFPGDYGTGKPDSCLRKWERDKAELVDMGLPLRWIPPTGDGDTGGYVLDRAQYFLGDLDLAPEERALLSVAGAAALEQPQFPLRTDLAHALNKLLFEDAARGEGPGPRSVPLVHLPAAGAELQAGVLEALGQAVAARKDVGLSYRAFDGAVTERAVSPYGLAYRRGAWFLVGHCHLRGGLRTFQVERIASLSRGKGTSRGPDFDVPQGFDARAVVGREPWEFAVHPPVEVEIRLDPVVALLARSRFGRDAVVLEDDAGASVKLRVTYGEALVREVLRLAPHAELVSPPSLRERVAEVAGRLAAVHEGEGESAAAVRAAERVDAWAADARTSPGEADRLAADSRMAPGSGTRAITVPGDLRERLRRALFLIPYAVANPGCRVDDLAAAARLSPDQLLAELDFLRMVGRPPYSPADLIDIDVSNGRVEVALPQGLLRPPSLTPLEAAALDAAASALAAEGGEALSRAREKLRAAIPTSAREQFDSVAGRVLMDHGGLELEVARLLDRAIAERRELELTYFTAARGEARRRSLRPLERVLHQGYWYLHAFCCERRDRRLFRLDRAADLVLTERTFVPRPSDDDARFRRPSLHAPGANAPFARVRIAEGPWTRAESLRRLGAVEVVTRGDGSAEATLPADGEAFVAATVLSLGGDAELLESGLLRERVHTAALATRERHERR
ncbi:helix-turn-helix transcriptional regulator [Vulgatibacter incomptus]|uniref:Putative DeoR-family transcriptional regulator n=1 Tax=Vulgatibacter incomptus TaxID=1391653 RepID=A0A0K1P9T8_9BACT|nr:WYL domain-containing protein [Vulgatibacter incomptus]AKU90280.1 Putative DeoR-family transcriptional regulator [Vulgatibacter incomptus]